MQGKEQAQKLFMGGRMKIRGDMMKAMKVEVSLVTRCFVQEVGVGV